MLQGDSAALFTPAQAAQFLQCSKKALENWRLRKRGPTYHKCGKLVRYSQPELLEWLASNAVRSAAPANDAIGNR